MAPYNFKKTSDMPREYTWSGGFGSYSFPANDCEVLFITWAMQQGFEEHEAVFAMANDGETDRDIPYELIDQYAAFEAGFQSGQYLAFKS